MKKTSRRTTRRDSATVQPNAFGRQALLTFERLDPGAQVVVLNMLARWPEPKVPPSRLYTTKAQRAAAREMRAIGRTMETERAQAERERLEMRRRLNEMHNRAGSRRSRGRYFTAAEEKRYDALHTRLQTLDYKLGYSNARPAVVGGAR